MQPQDVVKVSNIPLPTLGKLYLGSKNILSNYQDYGIHHIITLLSPEDAPSRKLPIQRHDIYVLDDNFNDKTLLKMIDILEETAQTIHTSLTSGRNVGVHCYMGVSRSATVILDYLLTYHMKDKGLNEACRWLRKHRPVISPNIGFQQLLREKHE